MDFIIGETLRLLSNGFQPGGDPFRYSGTFFVRVLLFATLCHLAGDFLNSRHTLDEGGKEARRFIVVAIALIELAVNAYALCVFR